MTSRLRSTLNPAGAYLPFVLLYALTVSSFEAQAEEEASTLAALSPSARVRALTLASPYRISPKARRGRIRYTLSLTGEQSWPWPQTAEQRVTVTDAGILIDVCPNCDWPAAPPPASDAQLAATPWLNHADRRLKGLARKAGKGTQHQQLTRLIEAVRGRLNRPVDYRHYWSATVAYRQRRGDCTEFALLLAATARARGHPTRIAAGIAYASRFGSGHRFTPHTWVQVWDGQRWRSYDAAFDAFGAGHILLAVGNGEPEAFNGVLALINRLEVKNAVGVRESER